MRRSIALQVYTTLGSLYVISKHMQLHMVVLQPTRNNKRFIYHITVLFLPVFKLTSIMSLFVRLSCGSLYSVYLSRTLSMSVLAYWNSLLELLKMMRAISQSHKTLSSYAFFINPNFLLVKVTCKIQQHVFKDVIRLCSNPTAKLPPFLSKQMRL